MLTWSLVMVYPRIHPLVGDWNGDGTDTVGIYRNGAFLPEEQQHVQVMLTLDL